MTLPDPDRSEARGDRPTAPLHASSNDFLAVTIAAFQVLWKPVAVIFSGFFIAYAVGWLWFGGGGAWLWSLLTGGGA
ncbi:hypothetical protein [Deinococcus yavapaiensis]|uniref:hypothetical protein n=1 Tax=Deinococcus yavapaiensis TaxID=309889 RepID=UPI000DA224A2|nr:hypothetical protein [Deinococcus yavapaiensis]